MATVERTRRGIARRWFGVVAALAAFAGIAVAAPPAGATTAHGRIIQKPCLDLHVDRAKYGPTLGCIPYNTTIAIQCTDSGDEVRGPYNVSRIWDRTTYVGKTGFVTDAFVYTGTNNPVAPSCLGPRHGRIVRTPCLPLRHGTTQTKQSPVLTCVPWNTALAISCTKRGDSVLGPWGATKVWDHVTFNGFTGYLSDAWVYTATQKPVAPPC